MKYLVMLNTVYENGEVAEIISSGFVTSLEDGELWFNMYKPDDGTQVDYTIFSLMEIRKGK